ncbi:MAG: hypothetical protein ACON4G_02450 [Candidatus Puniceispirillaceae bacterium]
MTVKLQNVPSSDVPSCGMTVKKLMHGPIIGLILAGTFLTGCADQSALVTSQSASDQASDQASQTVSEDKATEPQLASLFFTWSVVDTTIISPPVEIQNQAIMACQERGFDSSYMIHLALGRDSVTAEFGCRGADQ